MKLYLTLQAYVEVADLTEALEEAKALVALVEPLAAIADCHVSRYWKIPEQHGVWLKFSVEDAHATYRTILAVLAADWDLHGGVDDKWAVWNAHLNGPSPLKSARWLHLEMLPE